LNRRSLSVARRSKNQENQENQEDQEDQEYQEFRVKSTKTLSYSHHQDRFEDIHQQEYQARKSNAKAKHKDQNFQACIDDNHGRS
jgi:hypothetical protein